MSVCSEKMLDVVPLLRIVLPHFFRTLAIIVPCTIVGYAVPVRGESFLPLLLLLSCSPLPPFVVRFSLLTPRFRRAACATSAVGASFHATALTARFLLGLFLFPLVKALLPPYGWQSFTRHLSLHSSPSLCTHEAVSSVRSNAFCVHNIWLLRLLFHFSTAKLRQAVCLKYRLAICFTKMSAAFRTFPVWLLVKSGYSNIFP